MNALSLIVLVVAALAGGCIDAAGPERPPRQPPPGSGWICGDGVCSAGETCATCPFDCGGVCPPPCDAIDLGVSESVWTGGTLTAAPAELTGASCGGATGDNVPTIHYAWIPAAAGLYHIEASGAGVGAIQARQASCAGPEIGCSAAAARDDAGLATLGLDLRLPSGQPLAITIGGRDAAATGDLTLAITRAPDSCGDNACEPGEDCASCPTDCGDCPPPAFCGDGICQSDEDCASCPADCDTCSPACGDRVCDPGETCTSCPTDCSCGPVCGDGSCDAGEDCSSCPTDCDPCDEAAAAPRTHHHARSPGR